MSPQRLAAAWQTWLRVVFGLLAVLWFVSTSGCASNAARLRALEEASRLQEQEEQAARLREEAERYASLGNDAEAEAAARRALEQASTPASKALSCGLLADVLAARSERLADNQTQSQAGIDEAIDLYRQVLQRTAKVADLMRARSRAANNLGVLLIITGRGDEALEILEAELPLVSEDFKPRFLENLANSFLKNNQPVPAYSLLLRAIKLSDGELSPVRSGIDLVQSELHLPKSYSLTLIETCLSLGRIDCSRELLGALLASDDWQESSMYGDLLGLVAKHLSVTTRLVARLQESMEFVSLVEAEAPERYRDWTDAIRESFDNPPIRIILKEQEALELLFPGSDPGSFKRDLAALHSALGDASFDEDFARATRHYALASALAPEDSGILLELLDTIDPSSVPSSDVSDWLEVLHHRLNGLTRFGSPLSGTELSMLFLALGDVSDAIKKVTREESYGWTAQRLFRIALLPVTANFSEIYPVVAVINAAKTRLERGYKDLAGSQLSADYSGRWGEAVLVKHPEASPSRPSIWAAIEAIQDEWFWDQGRAGFLLTNPREKAQTPVKLAALPEDLSVPSRGGAGAPVQIISYGDFENEASGAVAELMKFALASYKNRIQLDFRPYPMRRQNPNSQKAAEAFFCAAKQREAWRFYDQMFEQPDGLTLIAFERLAEQLSLNRDEFSHCLSSGAQEDLVTKSLEEGFLAGVRDVPAFFVNGRLVKGPLPRASLKKMIDEELAMRSRTASKM